MDTAVIVLAAGAGTRMKSDLPKVAHTIMDKPMVQWVLETAQAAGIERKVAVVGYGRDIVIPLVEPYAQVAIQEQQNGTAHAVLCAKEALAGFEGSVVVLSGDSPLITPQTISQLIATREEQDAAVVVLTMKLDDPFGYGRIVRDPETGDVLRIVEQKDASEDIQAICECNSGFYCFDAKALFEALDQVNSENAQGEFYLTDVLEISRNAGRKVLGLQVQDNTECLGVNTVEQLATAAAIMEARLAG